MEARKGEAAIIYPGHRFVSGWRPITSAALRQPARRPPRTGFFLDKARQELDYRPRSFHQGLEIVKGQLGE